MEFIVSITRSLTKNIKPKHTRKNPKRSGYVKLLSKACKKVVKTLTHIPKILQRMFRGSMFLHYFLGIICLLLGITFMFLGPMVGIFQGSMYVALIGFVIGIALMALAYTLQHKGGRL